MRKHPVRAQGADCLLLELCRALAHTGVYGTSNNREKVRVRPSRDSARVRVVRKVEFMAARILIADDSVSMRKALRRMLEEAGNWEIVEVEDGQQALDKAVQIHPDLIILDIAMPVMNGFNSARKLKKVLPEVPIIVHTLYCSPQTVTEALKAGAEKAMAKSESRKLIAAVKEKLAERKTDAGWRPRGAASLVGSPTLVPGYKREGGPERSRGTHRSEPRRKIPGRLRPQRFARIFLDLLLAFKSAESLARCVSTFSCCRKLLFSPAPIFSAEGQACVQVWRQREWA